jgi:predicted alpha/beta-fold hydrolase
MNKTVTADFTPAWWLPGPHVQTLWQPLFRVRPKPAAYRERLATPDGDFLDLDWFGPEGRFLVILLHGLSGSSRSPYIRGMQMALANQGLQTVAINFRGCSGHPNHTSRGYHSGETRDFDHVVTTLSQRRPELSLGAVGYSLGGNVLLKWLGERGETATLSAAVAVSAPLRLDLCADRLDNGFSKLYRNQLLKELKDFVNWKREHLEFMGEVVEAQKLQALGDLSGIQSFWEYDYKVVARLYGFESASDYYQKSSARQFLGQIRRPTLIIHSRDDPFMTPAVIPHDTELSASVRLELTDAGGHVGFVSGPLPWRPRYWLEERIPRFMQQQFDCN